MKQLSLCGGFILVSLASLQAQKSSTAVTAESVIPEEVVEKDPALTLAETGVTIVDCYDTSVVNLERICEDYRRIKALQLSKIRDIAFPDAYRNVEPVMPLLKPVNRELLRRRLTDPNDITKHKVEVERVEAEVANMVELAAKLLLEIEEVQQQMVEEMATDAEMEAKTLAEIVNSPDYDPEKALETENQQRNEDTNKELTEKAKEKPEQPAVDLSKEMQALTPPPPPPPSSTGTQVADKTPPPPPPPGSDQKTETGKSQPPPTPPPGSDKKQAGKSMPPPPPPGAEKEIKGMPLPKSSGVSTSQIAATAFKIPEMNMDVGRRVVRQGGAPVEWMFIDTWYTIGPFPNPNRVNLNTKFPPETVVNLSATYKGKDNKTVGWEFLQTNRVMCVPLNDEEYAIYYAYTELWFDDPIDLWVAIGSDDKANVWVNGLPIWISGDQLKGWKVNEGLRKVHFKQGVNKVLYRVENGWHGTAFSLGIQVKP
jgi:hypothetical protein